MVSKFQSLCVVLILTCVLGVFVGPALAERYEQQGVIVGLSAESNQPIVVSPDLFVILWVAHDKNQQCGGLWNVWELPLEHRSFAATLATLQSAQSTGRPITLLGAPGSSPCDGDDQVTTRIDIADFRPPVD